MRRGGQPAVWAAGVSSWNPAKAAYSFAEELPTHSTQYRTAVLEVNRRCPDPEQLDQQACGYLLELACCLGSWRSYHPVSDNRAYAAASGCRRHSSTELGPTSP